jgi:hypothetical protein
MSRTTRVVWLAALAVLAIGAIGAPGAQAQTTKFTGVRNLLHVETFLTVKQLGKQVFELTNSKDQVSCTEAGAGGIIPLGEAETVVLENLELNDCTFAATATNTTVTTNGCKLTLTTPESIGSGREATGKVDLFCPTEKEIEMHIYTKGSPHTTDICTLTVFADQHSVTGGQEEDLGGHVIYRIEATNDLSAAVTLTELTYEEHGALCPDGNTVRRHDLDYTGELTISGEDANGNPVTVFHG